MRDQCAQLICATKGTLRGMGLSGRKGVPKWSWLINASHGRVGARQGAVEGGEPVECLLVSGKE